MNNPNPHKYGAVQIFCDPANYLSHSLERTEKCTLRFPSKYEYKVYCALTAYLTRTNRNYLEPRYFLECQFQITLLSKTVLTSAINHIVDFVIRDNQAAFNPALYVEAKGQFLPEYNQKMKLLQALKPNVYSRYLVISDNEPPKSYTSYYGQFKKIEAALYALGIK